MYKFFVCINHSMCIFLFCYCITNIHSLHLFHSIHVVQVTNIIIKQSKSAGTIDVRFCLPCSFDPMTKLIRHSMYISGKSKRMSSTETCIDSWVWYTIYNGHTQQYMHILLVNASSCSFGSARMSKICWWGTWEVLQYTTNRIIRSYMEWLTRESE